MQRSQALLGACVGQPNAWRSAEIWASSRRMPAPDAGAACCLLLRRAGLVGRGGAAAAATRLSASRSNFPGVQGRGGRSAAISLAASSRSVRRISYRVPVAEGLEPGPSWLENGWPATWTPGLRLASGGGNWRSAEASKELCYDLRSLAGVSAARTAAPECWAELAQAKSLSPQVP